jgi:hypothetical protein
MSSPFHGLSQDDKNMSVSFIRWCRDLYVVFERYGVEQVTTVIQTWEQRRTVRDGHWSERVIFDLWRGYWEQRGDDGARVLAGWLRSDARIGSEDRIRRLAIDGHFVDPLTEVTSLDQTICDVLGISWNPVRVRTSDACVQTMEDGDRRSRRARSV